MRFAHMLKIGVRLSLMTLTVTQTLAFWATALCVLKLILLQRNAVDALTS